MFACSLYEPSNTYFVQLFLCYVKVTLSSWQDFEAERETLSKFISNTSSELHKELIFNSLDSLRTELQHSKVCVFVNVFCACINYIVCICLHSVLASFLSVGSLHWGWGVLCESRSPPGKGCRYSAWSKESDSSHAAGPIHQRSSHKTSRQSQQEVIILSWIILN